MSVSPDIVLSDEGRRLVEEATVRVLKLGGRGVVVPGAFILTAAHCIEWSGTGAMVLGDHFLESVQCGGREILTSVWAADPVVDIAVLGPPDIQTFYEESELYDEVLATIRPIPLCQEEFEPFKEIPAAVWSHKGEWLDLRAKLLRKGVANIWVESQKQIEGGTSGSPVVDRNGRLIGLISHASETSEPCTGSIPRPNRALPVWLIEKITNEENGNNE